MANFERWARNHIERLEADVGKLEKVAGQLNHQLIEVRLSNQLLVEAIEEVTRDRNPDLAAALARLST